MGATTTPLLARARPRALVHVAFGVALAVVLEVVLMVDGPAEPTWLILAFPLAASTYGAAGIEAWRRRPSNRVGSLLVLGGWAWLLAGLANVENQWLVAVGQVSSVLGIAVIVHLVLAFPSGRLLDRASRWIVVAAYITTTIFEVPVWMFDPAGSPVLRVADDPSLDRLAEWTQRSIGWAVLVAAATVCARRLHQAAPATRRALAPVLGYGIFTAVMVPLSANVIQPLTGISPIALATIQLTVVTILPIAFVVGLLRGGFARTGELVELGASLAADLDWPQLSETLAGTLGDPSVKIGFWLPTQRRYVDGDGHPFDVVAGAGRHRGDADIAVAGRHVGVITYDAVLVPDADLVHTAGRVLAIAVDRLRLDAELRASRDALRASRSRIWRAAEAERRRIARDLHDGLQGRMILLGVRAQRLADRLGAEDERADAVSLRAAIDVAIDELRGLVHGVMPPLLIERGLRAAVAELVDDMPIAATLDAPADLRPLPAPIESAAYLVVAEGLANAMKHSGATRIVVRLAVVDDDLVIDVRDDGSGGAALVDGSGLRGIEDRVDVLGGQMSLMSPAGDGTHVRVELPCAS